MQKIAISGCNGRMGQTVARLCQEESALTIGAGFDKTGKKLSDFPVYRSFVEFTGRADCIIDFSSTSALGELLSYSASRGIPLVLCVTGYSETQLSLIEDAAKTLPIFKSANMSMGINLLKALVEKAAKVLGESFDLEIVERHHRTKVDAPSGTALLLADAASSALGFETEYIYERQSIRKPRGKKEIGISAVRGGTIVGEHEVIFAGSDEVLELKHAAYSRDVFANGAIRAARFMTGVTRPGLYTMEHLIAAALSDS